MKLLNQSQQPEPKNRSILGYQKIRSLMLTMVFSALSFCSISSAFAWDNRPCDFSVDFCIMLIADKSLPEETELTSNLSYDVGSARVQLADSKDFLSPSTNVIAFNASVDLLTRVQIKNIQFNITQISGNPAVNCSLKTPVGRRVLPGYLKMRVLYNAQTASFSCKSA